MGVCFIYLRETFIKKKRLVAGDAFVDRTTKIRSNAFPWIYIFGGFQALLDLEMNSDLKASLHELYITGAKVSSQAMFDWIMVTSFGKGF